MYLFPPGARLPVSSYGVHRFLSLLAVLGPRPICLHHLETESIHGEVKLPKVDGPPFVRIEKVEDFADLQGSSTFANDHTKFEQKEGNALFIQSMS